MARCAIFVALALAVLAMPLAGAGCSRGAAGDAGAGSEHAASQGTGAAASQEIGQGAGGENAASQSAGQSANPSTGQGAGSPTTGLKIYSRDFFALDTIISVSLYAASEQEANTALDAVEAAYSGVHEKMTRFADESLADPSASQIYMANSGAGGEPVPIEGETFALLKRALEYCALSGGAFDVGLGAVSDLWDFNGENRIPSDAELAEALALGNYRDVALGAGENTVSLPAGMKLDLGGIAKGYATQKSAELLRGLGIRHAIINAGGNVYALGGKPAESASQTAKSAQAGQTAQAGPSGQASLPGAGFVGAAISDATLSGAGLAGADAKTAAGADSGSGGAAPNGGQFAGGLPWKVGIKHPRNEGALLAAIEVADQAVVTSGDYEKYFEAGGERYHHILDPRTGKPAGSCVSVTIVTGDSTLADYLSTAAFVLGPEAGMALVESFPGTYAVFVDRNFEITVSKGLEGRIAFY
jgi:thiamine biosynthesis lipoprotein ApbE